MAYSNGYFRIKIALEMNSNMSVFIKDFTEIDDDD